MLAVAFTGMLATMPYIALQLLGIQVVIKAMGVTGAGWLVGMISGTAMVAASGFRSPIYTIHFGETPITAYAGVFALAANLLVAVALTPVCDALGVKRRQDQTVPEDYDEEAVEAG